MRYVLVILFFALINNLSGMDAPPPKIKKKRTSFDDLPFAKKWHSDDRTKKKSPLAVTPEKPHGLLDAARDNNIGALTFYLKNIHLDINDIIDTLGNTALHLAASNNRFEIIEILLNDHRLDARRENKEKKIASGLFHNVENSTEKADKILYFKRMLFARYALNIVVHQKAIKLLHAYTSGRIDQSVINGMVEAIKKKIENDKITQDEALPAEAQLPAYANDAFITNMLYYQLSLLH